MNNLRHIRQRLKVLSSTKKMTSAMKMVSGSKFRRAHHQFQHHNKTFQDFQTLVQNTLSWITYPSELDIFLKPSRAPVLFLVFTTDRGLCGGLNANLLRFLKKVVNTESSCFAGIIGNKGKDALKHHVPLVDFEIPSLAASLQDPIYLSHALSHILDLRSQNTIGNVMCIRAKFHSILENQLIIEPLFPITEEKSPKFEKALYGIVETPSTDFFSQLFTQLLLKKLFRNASESYVCEQAARRIAMDQAARNTTDLISKLHLQYNQTRQNQITGELIEIVSGASALA